MLSWKFFRPITLVRAPMFLVAHRYTRNAMNITYAKIKKNSRSRFFKPQPARASLIHNTVPLSMLMTSENICVVHEKILIITRI